MKSLSTERRQQIEALFLAAVELPLAEQQSFVESSTETDSALRAQVLQLLAADRNASQVVGELADDLNVGAMFEDNSASGESYGQYVLVERIGLGGMGEVWRAKRADGRFEGEVAIKLLRVEQMNNAVMARFEQEGRLLARLVHPNIARLMDAGVSDASKPYLVLELVDGCNIDQYCANQQLDLKQRLRLFMDVLDAIAHAHANLVLHRDVKPSNVLVTEQGVVKLLDFGVATLIHNEGRDAGLTTAYGAALTPEYAAPEQLLGEPVTTATDTYALGLLLYRLLTGRNPRHNSDETPYTLLQAIRCATEEFPKASSAITKTSVHAKALNGDLDNIIAKALAPDPSDRYRTAMAFAEDLRRFLRYEPVQAQAPTLTYRIGKFVRRHRGGVLSATLMVIGLIAAVFITTAQTFEATRQREIAENERRQAQANHEFFTLMLEEMSDTPFTPVELLDRGADMLNQQYNTDDVFIGGVFYSLAGRYGALNERNRQTDMLNQTVMIARQHQNEQLLAAGLCSLATQTLATDANQSATYASEGLSNFAKLSNPSMDALVACLRLQARQAEVERDFDLARSHVQNALAQMTAQAVTSSHTQGALLTHLSHIEFSAGKPASALPILQEVLVLLKNNGRENTIAYLQTVSNMAAVLSDLGRLPEAADLQRTTLSTLQESGYASRGISAFLQSTARTLTRMQQYTEAARLIQQGLELAQEAGDQETTAHHHMGLARIAMSQRDYTSAVLHLDEAEAYFKLNPDAAPGQLVNNRVLKTKVLRYTGQLQAAEQKISQLLDELGYPDVERVRGLLSALIEAAAVYQAIGELDQAETLASDVIERLSQVVGDPLSSVDVARSYVHRAEIRSAKGLRRLALEDLDRALPIMRDVLGADHKEVQKTEKLMAEQRALR